MLDCPHFLRALLLAIILTSSRALPQDAEKQVARKKAASAEDGLPSQYPIPPGTGHSTCYFWRTKNHGYGEITPARAHLIDHKKKLSVVEDDENVKDDGTTTRLARRNTPVGRSKYIDTTTTPGACGVTYSGDRHYVCPWTGRSGDQFNFRNSTPGWLTGSSPYNCFKQVYLHATDDNSTAATLYANVIDGCGIDESATIDSGCADIFVSRSLFIALGGDLSVGSVHIHDWDFESGHKYNLPY